MRFVTNKSIIDMEKEEAFDVGDVVNIKWHDGGGCGSCTITKITDTGFSFKQGTGKVKNAQYKNIAELY